MLLNRGVLTTNGVVDRLMKSRISRIHVKQDIFFWTICKRYRRMDPNIQQP